MLASISAATVYLLIHDRWSGKEEARQHAENLAYVFEEEIARAFRSADDMAVQLRRSYQRDQTGTDLVGWVSDPQLQKELKFQYSIVGPDGVITASSYGPATLGINIASRKHFQVHVNNFDDQLFVSEPLISKSSGRMAIFLTRRLPEPMDRSTACSQFGLISFSLKPSSASCSLSQTALSYCCTTMGTCSRAAQTARRVRT